MPGRDFLQVPGPTNIPGRVLRAMDRPAVDHRGPEFIALTHRVLPKLREVFRTERGAPVIFMGSGTAGLEAALVNTLSPGDRVLAFGIGHFSHLFARIATRLGCEVELAELPWGSVIPPDLVYDRLSADREPRYKAVLAIHNETSTGVTCDIPAIREAMDRAGHPALLLVDTISGLGSIDFRFDEWGVDVAVAASQKGLLLPPGLAILAVSDRALRAGESARLPRHFFDWAPVIEFNRKGFFPFTPATLLLFGLDEALDLLQEEGLEQVYARHALLGEGVRRAVEAWSLPLVAQERATASDVVTGIRLPEGHDAARVPELSAERYGLSLGIGIGPLQGKAFRIGHLGSLNELEVLAVLGGVEMTLDTLGVPLPLGEGVTACQRWFLSRSAPVAG